MILSDNNHCFCSFNFKFSGNWENSNSHYTATIRPVVPFMPEMLVFMLEILQQMRENENSTILDSGAIRTADFR